MYARSERRWTGADTSDAIAHRPASTFRLAWPGLTYSTSTTAATHIWHVLDGTMRVVGHPSSNLLQTKQSDISRDDFPTSFHRVSACRREESQVPWLRNAVVAAPRARGPDHRAQRFAQPVPYAARHASRCCSTFDGRHIVVPHV